MANLVALERLQRESLEQLRHQYDPIVVAAAAGEVALVSAVYYYWSHGDAVDSFGIGTVVAAVAVAVVSGVAVAAAVVVFVGGRRVHWNHWPHVEVCPTENH